MFKSKATTQLLTFSMVAGLAGFAGSAQAEGGDWGPGSGGGACDSRIQEIKNDIAHWIEEGDYYKLEFPEGMTAIDYKTAMLQQLALAEYSCVEENLFLDPAKKQHEKECINEPRIGTDSGRIRCTLSKFMSLGEEEQYRLIHHEYAGLAKLEYNSELSDGELDEESNYVLSDQVGGFLEEVTIKRLSIGRRDFYVGTTGLSEVCENIFTNNEEKNSRDLTEELRKCGYLAELAEEDRFTKEIAGKIARQMGIDDSQLGELERVVLRTFSLNENLQIVLNWPVNLGGYCTGLKEGKSTLVITINVDGRPFGVQSRSMLFSLDITVKSGTEMHVNEDGSNMRWLHNRFVTLDRLQAISGRRMFF